MKVALDAGHGCKNFLSTGAKGNGLVEDSIALAVAHKVRWYLVERGVSVVMTRADQKMVQLKARAKLAKQEKCDAFVSIHCNASGNPHAQGAEAFIVVSDHNGAELADRIMDVLTSNGMKNRGTKADSKGQHASIYVLRNTYSRMPATLIELGFLTNKEDATRLRDKVWIEGVASGIAQAIAEFLKD